MTDKPASSTAPCSAHHVQCKMDSNGGHCTMNQGHDGEHHCHACGMSF